MNRRSRELLDAVETGPISVVGVVLGLFVFGLAVHRAWAVSIGAPLILLLVPFASVGASAWWESRDGGPLVAIGLGVTPFVGLASLPVYYALFGTPFVTRICAIQAGGGAVPCTPTFGAPVSFLLMLGLVLGAGGYALGILWDDVVAKRLDQRPG